MCRILFALGDGEEIKPLAEALRRASEHDPYRLKLSGKESHADGWGYVLLKDGEVYHYRSIEAIFEDEEGFSGLLNLLRGRVVLLAHARAASQGGKSLFNVQPFPFSSCRGFSFWFLHNGDLNKEEIVRRASFDGKDFQNASDSYTFGAYLCRFLEGPDGKSLLRVYSAGVEVTKTSFNTMTLFMTPEGKWKAFVTAYMVQPYLEDPVKRDYARLIELREPFAVASSTLGLYHEAEWRDVPNGSAYLVDEGSVVAMRLG